MSSKNNKEDPILSELVAIKRLLIAGLQRVGASQSEIAKALGVTQSGVSRMLGRPPGKK